MIILKQTYSIKHGHESSHFQILLKIYSTEEHVDKQQIPLYCFLRKTVGINKEKGELEMCQGSISQAATVNLSCLPASNTMEALSPCLSLCAGFPGNKNMIMLPLT